MELTSTELQSERLRRQKILQKLMDDARLDALLFTSTAQPAYQVAVKYATGYPLITRRDIVYMKNGKEPYLIVPTKGQQFHARRISWLPEENILFGDFSAYIPDMITGTGSEKLRIGVYESDDIPVSLYKHIISTGAELIDITRNYTEARRSKSEVEIALIREASRIAIASFEHVIRLLEPGKTECELIGAAEGFLRMNGAEDMIILTCSQKPHTFISKPMPIPIKEDGIFIYSAEFAGPHGYWTQIVRPVFMSNDTQPEAFEILHAIKKAEAAGVKEFVVGKKISDIAAAVENVIAKYGFKMGVWSGHGMGADLGDGVDIGTDNDMAVVPNMVLTLHPSVMSENDGLLFGNTWLSTEGEAECLTPQYRDEWLFSDLKSIVPQV